MSREKEYQKGAWHYTEEHLYEKFHTLPNKNWLSKILHKISCNYEETTYHRSTGGPWTKKEIIYDCGYTVIIERYRNEEDE